MIPIEVEPNPNSEGADYQVFQEVGSARPLRKMHLSRHGEDALYWITGMDEMGNPCQAYAQKVADSGGGTSHLIFGGKWGIRFKPDADAGEPWNLKDNRQWGEPFKFYGDEADLFYAD